MKPERIQVFGGGGMFLFILEALFPFSTHDDAADFSKTVRRIAGNMGHEVELSISESHVVRARFELEKKAELNAVEQELTQKLRIAFEVLSSQVLSSQVLSSQGVP